MTDGDILSTAMWLYDGRVPLGVRIRYQSTHYGAAQLSSSIVPIIQSWNSLTGRCSSARGRHTNQ